MNWTRCTGISALCQTLGVDEKTYRQARSRINRSYIEKTIIDSRNGKARQLCYPPKVTALYFIQKKLVERILAGLELLPEIRGYRSGSHNINTAAAVCGHKYMGKVDISKFHPSTGPSHIVAALRDHKLSPSWSREIARIATYKGGLPQGAASSNHLANVVMDSYLRRDVKPLADQLGVGFLNYGDDIVFFGPDPTAVAACVSAAKKSLSKLGFKTNEKCRDCEHRGAQREFIGCATGRQAPDYPRSKYRAFRMELRGLLQAERKRATIEPLTSKEQLNSLKHRIVYVKRLNKLKARKLLSIFYLLCEARRSHVTPISTHSFASLQTIAPEIIGSVL